MHLIYLSYEYSLELHPFTCTSLQVSFLWPSSTPLLKYTFKKIHSSVHGHLGCFQDLLLNIYQPQFLNYLNSK